MKTLFVSLLIASTLFSCGKKNEVSSNANASASNPITVNVPHASDLGSKIDNHTTKFGIGQIYYYGYPETFQSLITKGANLQYRYTKSSTTTSLPNGCDRVLKYLVFCSSFGANPIQVPVTSRTIENNSVDITSKQNELKAIVNNVNPLIPIQTNGVIYDIVTKDNKYYRIDTSAPLQANPVSVGDSNGAEYLYWYKY